MKSTLTLALPMLFASITSAQINTQTPWTWMKGDNIADQTGNYGNKGVTAVSNKPGSRTSSATWRDAAGNLWLFGGSGYAASDFGYLNDLWKYDPVHNAWTWLHGDSTAHQYCSYGTQGVAAATNRPGGAYASVSWTDNAGNLWLFGGYGFSNSSFGFLNALWKYNTNTNQWTWVKGDSTADQPGIYGIQGTASHTTMPGARYGSRTWTDSNGNLWLYGGYGFNSTGSGILNDIWKYDPATNQWTWLKGDDTIEATAVYGTKGISNAANQPGSRYVSSSWNDADGNLWLFGGYGYDENNTGSLSDLWKYDPSSNNWTWISGDSLIDQAGRYGTKGAPSATNNPGARYVSSSWTDKNGDLWLFGGYGMDVSTTGYLNDLWRYRPSTNQWTWMKGDNSIDNMGVYGIQGLPDPANKSGARTGSVSWTDGSGNLWLFGGYGFDGASTGVLNDMWKIMNLESVLPLHLVQFSGIQNGESVQLNWKTEDEYGTAIFEVQRSFDGSNFITIGTINSSDNSHPNVYSFTDNCLKGRPSQIVYYRLHLVDQDKHYTTSRVLHFDFKKSGTEMLIFPNPSSDFINLGFDQLKKGTVTISISDMKGIIYKKQTEELLAGRVSQTIDITSLPAGMYLLTVSNGETVSTKKIVKY